MKRRRGLLPVSSLAMLTVAAILPWGLASEYRFVLPLMPIVCIYSWTLDADAWLPEWAIFFAGLMLDVLMQGPLGYWALVYLTAYVIAVFASRLRAETVASRLALFAVAILAVTTFAWLAASCYFFDILDWKPYAIGAAFAFLAASAISVLVGLLKSARRPERPVRLTRGA